LVARRDRDWGCGICLYVDESGSRIKGQFDCPICIQPCDAIPPKSVYVGEEAADENAIVRFNCKRLNPGVGHRIKSEIERAVSENARNKGAIGPRVLDEATAENDLAVMLQCQRENVSTSPYTGIE